MKLHRKNKDSKKDRKYQDYYENKREFSLKELNIEKAIIKGKLSENEINDNKSIVVSIFAFYGTVIGIIISIIVNMSNIELLDKIFAIVIILGLTIVMVIILCGYLVYKFRCDDGISKKRKEYIMKLSIIEDLINEKESEGIKMKRTKVKIHKKQ